MRIIAGTSRGIRSKMVPGKHVRPTTDRVKESLFQVIGPFFDNGLVLDLFAGSGALGLEALSRGMERAIFVDQSRSSVETIKHNVKVAKMGSVVEIYRLDASHAIRLFKQKGLMFQLIFLDPPYDKNLLSPLLAEISKYNLLDPDGLVVVEYPTSTPPQKEMDGLIEIRQLLYGNTSISLYNHKRGIAK